MRRSRLPRRLPALSLLLLAAAPAALTGTLVRRMTFASDVWVGLSSNATGRVRYLDPATGALVPLEPGTTAPLPKGTHLFRFVPGGKDGRTYEFNLYLVRRTGSGYARKNSVYIVSLGGRDGQVVQWGRWISGAYQENPDGLAQTAWFSESAAGASRDMLVLCE